ncbi:MAG TPA: hypothetical protein VE967_08575 [Gemmatimonadaceae bacterium]|nr:hypothetical protein [Gemmatimonadaceae bacterium]
MSKHRPLAVLVAALLTAAPALHAQDAKPATFSLAQFRTLKWIAGSWRGVDGNGKPFYEEYRVVDDSTIGMRQYTDSTFTAVTPDSSLITWRAGVVTSKGSGSPFIAAEMTPTSVKFARGSTRNFAFTRDSPSQWTARINSGLPGVAEVVYVMRRVPRP